MNAEKPTFIKVAVISRVRDETKGIVHCRLSDERTISMLAARGYPEVDEILKLWFDKKGKLCVATWAGGMADLKDRLVLKRMRPAANVDGDDYDFNPVTRRVFEAEKEAIRRQMGKKQAALECCVAISRAQTGAEPGVAPQVAQLQDAKGGILGCNARKCAARVY